MHEINELLKSNIGLVYQQLIRFRLSGDQDAESDAYEALYRAAKTYNKDSGNKFSTYAVCSIANALRTHIRKKNRKRQLEMISLYTPVSDTVHDGYLIDKLTVIDSAENTLCTLELRRRAAKAMIELVDKSTNDTQRKCLQMWINSDCSMSQTEIASKLNVSQAVVSRYINNFKHKLYLELEDYL